MRMLDLTGLGEHGNAIRMNLLEKSGLTDNRVVRDLNILENSVKEAAFHLRSDELGPTSTDCMGCTTSSRTTPRSRPTAARLPLC